MYIRSFGHIRSDKGVKMFDKNLDTLVVLSSVNRYYFSKIETLFGCVILHESEKIFLTDFRYYGYALSSLSGWNVIRIKTTDLYDAINSELVRLNAENVGYEDAELTAKEYNCLVSACSAFKFEPASDCIAAKRIIKTEDEIKRIASAQLTAQKALGKVVSIIKPDITEREVAANILYEIQMLGGDYAFDITVAFGEGSAQPYHKTSKRKLEKNDVVLINIGAKVDGYCTDMTRTFCVGNNEKIARIHRVVLEAQEYAIANIKAGLTGHEADSFAREYITAHGYGKEFAHALGHGVGIQPIEYPRLAKGSEDVLKPNMIITIEPGVYVESVGGVRIEDIAVVKEDGLLNLTNFDKNINL